MSDAVTKNEPQESGEKTEAATDAKTAGKSRPSRNQKEGDTPENEIMVAAKGQIKNYLGYAFRILNKTDHRKLTIRATGNAIVKALILIELVKRKVGEIYNYELHQQNKIYSMEIVSFEESKIEGMDKIESKRRVTAMDTVLSKDKLDENDPGYQYCKPEPKQEGAPGNQRKEGGKKKANKGPKQFNNFDKEQRRDKHEQEKSSKKKKGVEGGDESTAPQKDAKRGKNQKNSRKENLRNLINDDEVFPRPTDTRGGRGQRERGGKQRGRFNPEPPATTHHDSRYGRDHRQERYQGHSARSIDRFEARGSYRGDRRGGPPPEYRRGGPPNQGYYPQRGQYAQDYYDQYDYGPYYNMGPPPNRYNDYPQYREGHGPPPRRGGPARAPRGGPHPRDMRGPDMHEYPREQGPPMRSRGGPPRGMPPRSRGGYDEARDQSPDDYPPRGGRPMRARGRPMGERDYNGSYRGGPDRGGRGGPSGRGDMRGGHRGDYGERGSYRGGRGARGEPPHQEESKGPMIHQRSRGGDPNRD